MVEKLQAGGRSAALTAALAIPIALTFLILLSLRSQPDLPLQPAIFATGDWAPYSGKQLPDWGIASAVVASTASEAGYEANLQFMAWSQAYNAAADSRMNRGIRGTFPWYRTAAREREFYYSDALLEVELSIFYNAQNTPQLVEQVDRPGGLDRYRGVRVESYQYHPDIERLLSDAPMVPSAFKAFQQLIENPEVQFVAEARDVGKGILRDYFPEQQIAIEVSEKTWPISVHLLASRKNPNNRRLIEQFNKALAGMKGNGAYNILLADVRGRIDAERAVILHSFSSEGYLEGFLKPSSRESVLLPAGTRVVVEDWGDAYLAPAEVANRPDRVLVRVRAIDSPMKGQMLYVDGRTIRLP